MNDALKTAFAALACALLPLPSLAAEPKPMPEDAKVYIIWPTTVR